MSEGNQTSGQQYSDFDLLRYYRDEVKHEFNLLAMRTTILVTCQSFLVVPFAILNTLAANNFRAGAPLAFAIAVLGIYTACIIKVPILKAHDTIKDWRMKQYELLKGNPPLAKHMIERDVSNPSNDKLHEDSLYFSKHAPTAFIWFWLFAIVWGVVRILLDIWWARYGF